MVKAAVQNLVYHGVITIVPIFMYSNVYCLTPEVSKLREDEQLRTSFMEFIRKDPMDERFVSFKDVFRMISDFNNHTTVTDIVAQYRSVLILISYFLYKYICNNFYLPNTYSCSQAFPVDLSFMI